MIWQNKPTQSSTNVKGALLTALHTFSVLRKETEDKIQDCNLLLELKKKKSTFFSLSASCLRSVKLIYTYIYIFHIHTPYARLRDVLNLNYSSPYGHYGAITWAVLDRML